MRKIIIAFGILFALCALYLGWLWFDGGIRPIFPLPALLSLLLFASTKLPRRHQPKIILATCSLLLTLFAAEQFLYWWGNPLDFDNKRVMAALREGVVYDRRDALDVYIDLKDAGKDVVPFVPPNDFVWKSPIQMGMDGNDIFPLGGISNSTTVYCNESAEFILYQSDEYGFHNPPGSWQNQIDVAIVGDSYVQGACVPSDDNLVAGVRETYPRTLGLGTNGNGPLLQLALIKEYLTLVQPRIVVWAYFEGNDLTDMQGEKNNDFVMQYFQTGYAQGLMWRQEEIDLLRQQYVGALEHTRRTQGSPRRTSDNYTWSSTLSLLQVRRLLELIPADPAPQAVKGVHLGKVRAQELVSEGPRDAVGDYKLELFRQMIEELPENLPLFRAIMEDARQTVESWGGQMIVVYIPQWERYGYDMPPEAFQRQDILPILDAIEMPYVDLHPPLVAHGDPLALYPFRMTGHFSAEGYDLATNELVNYLQTIYAP